MRFSAQWDSRLGDSPGEASVRAIVGWNADLKKAF